MIKICKMNNGEIREAFEIGEDALESIAGLYSLNDAERFPSSHDVERPSTLYYADIKVAESFGLNELKNQMAEIGSPDRKNHQRR